MNAPREKAKWPKQFRSLLLDGVKRHKIRDNIRFTYVGDLNFSLGQLTVILLRVRFFVYFAFAKIVVKEVNAT